jgi:hypothetical protein
MGIFLLLFVTDVSDVGLHRHKAGMLGRKRLSVIKKKPKILIKILVCKNVLF